MKTVLIFGGSGFVGNHIIRRIAKNGYKIIIPHRNQINEAKLRLLGSTGQIIPINFKSIKEKKIVDLIKKADVILNLKTMWSEKHQTFRKSILDFNINLVDCIKEIKTPPQFIFFSGLGADEIIGSDRSKAIYESEKYIRKNLFNSSIIRPGIIIGGGDQFLKGLLPLFNLSFFIPLFGNGLSKFQPVFIDDVSLAINKIVKTNLLGNHIFELFGKEIFSYKEFYNYISKCMNKTRVLAPIPISIIRPVIKVIEKLGISPINSEQLKLFEKDNIASNNYENLGDLGLNSQDVREVVKKIISKNT